MLLFESEVFFDPPTFQITTDNADRIVFAADFPVRRKHHRRITQTIYKDNFDLFSGFRDLCIDAGDIARLFLPLEHDVCFDLAFSGIAQRGGFEPFSLVKQQSFGCQTDDEL